MAKYAFFLGCIAPLRYPGIEKSTRIVFDKLGIELADLTDASCCPAPGVIRAFSKITWLAAAARNLALAEQMGLPIMTVCNGCYGSLFEAAHELNHDEATRAQVNEVLAKIGMKYNGTTEVYHFAEVLYKEVGIEGLKAAFTKPLDYKIAVFYGCHFLKPSDIKNLGQDSENPRILDELVEATGCQSMDRRQKTLCCGSGGGLKAAYGDVAKQFTQTNLENMKESGAQAIVDVCPFCHLQFDTSQAALGFNIPVIHLSQLYGLAMGMTADELAFKLHKVDVAPLLQ